MKVPLTIRDHLRRAAVVYPDRIGVVDEPDQPAPSLGSITYRRIGELATRPGRRPRRARRRLGERVAVVSQNSARLLVSFFGVPAYGRVLVPINFRLNADEIGYIVEHSGATVLLVDPELDDVARRRRRAQHRFVLGGERRRRAVPRAASSREPWEPDEDATATINYTSGTTARPKGVQLTHRNLWLNATDVRVAHRRQRPRRLPAHAADVPLQRLGHAVRHHRRWA